MKRRLRTLLAATWGLSMTISTHADEGMWMPSQLPSITKHLHAAGFQGNLADLADLTRAPLNAVVKVGGATGDEPLMGVALQHGVVDREQAARLQHAAYLGKHRGLVGDVHADKQHVGGIEMAVAERQVGGARLPERGLDADPL